ncbi:polynucleotide kinase [Gordonia phage MScarn]|uniref:Polynucleotide kinase n=1 Tax=Gordonia phage MScarn TaxID=2836043 RepID=A0A8F3EDV5_9CAUD|nr:polynucleotide kinase [Gordonia phage MScarn]
MSIIIEGPDGAGKSMLLKSLLEDLPDMRPAPRFCTSTGGPVENLWAEVMTGALDLISSKLIYDRHPMWSEYIYSQELGRDIAPGFLTPSARQLADAMVSATTVVVCLPSLERVRANLEAEEQMSGVAEHIDRIYQAYMIRVVQYPGRVLVYDYTDAPSYFTLLSELRNNP